MKYDGILYFVIAMAIVCVCTFIPAFLFLTLGMYKVALPLGVGSGISFMVSVVFMEIWEN